MLDTLARRRVVPGVCRVLNAFRGYGGISHSMVKIRLMRVGMKGAPSYRVVIADARSPRDGRIIENIGLDNPLTNPTTFLLDSYPVRLRLQACVAAQKCVFSCPITQGRFGR